MAALNRARLTNKVHPGLPVTIPEIVADVEVCAATGADGAYVHVRDGNEAHVLSAGLYRELLEEFAGKMPNFYVEITTEAMGIYSPGNSALLSANCSRRSC